MKAAIFKEFGKPLAIETVADPTPEAGEVVIRVGRCGICGSDLHVTGNPHRLAPSGKILGHEWAGEVMDIGSGVTRVRKGDRVAVLPLSSCGACANCLAGEPAWCAARNIDGGGYGEYAKTHERQCFILPKSLSLEDGALVEPMAVGLHGVAISSMTPGARVLVVGAGPIGLATIFWAHRMGAGAIAVTASSRRRERLAHDLGGTIFLDPAQDMSAAAADALGGPPDIVFECVGAPGLIEKSIAAVRRRGTVVVLGLCWDPDTFTPGLAVGKEVRIQCAGFYSAREFEHSIEPFDRGDVAPRAMVTDTVSLAQFPAAFEALRERTHQCKVMLNPWP
jgi:(R,R)-butanediol dehydrogenase/meso-butanediol dehydrogenase/diacetyl reductase